ncbi:hypothetical protein [Kitasatospora sp. NPDC085879]|uniref:hypothetical protein n=1 Tax=Kitasatospora sp. NPDC085879 TaxID=3154769 RepID=UPI00343AE7D3
MNPNPAPAMDPAVTARLADRTGPLTDTALITHRRGVQVWRTAATGGPDAHPGQHLAVEIPDTPDILAPSARPPCCAPSPSRPPPPGFR